MSKSWIINLEHGSWIKYPECEIRSEHMESVTGAVWNEDAGKYPECEIRNEDPAKHTHEQNHSMRLCLHDIDVQLSDNTLLLSKSIR